MYKVNEIIIDITNGLECRIVSVLGNGRYMITPATERDNFGVLTEIVESGLSKIK